MADEQIKYAEGQHRPPKNLRMILKSSTMISPVQADEIVEMVKSHGGFPVGVPAAREEFREKYEDSGRAWVRKEAE